MKDRGIGDDSMQLPSANNRSNSATGPHDMTTETLLMTSSRTPPSSLPPVAHEKSNLEHYLEALGPAFGTYPAFYRSLIYSTIPQSILMAFVALAFFNCYTALAEATWLSEDYYAALNYDPTTATNNLAILDPIRLGNGEWWYVGQLAGAGFVVGLVKVLWNAAMPHSKLPKPLPNFLKDIRELHAENVWLPLPVLICSSLSIGLGASAGPEAALGFTGATVGSLIFGRNWNRSNSNNGATPPEAAAATDDPEATIPATAPATGTTHRSGSTSSSGSCLPDLSQDSMCCSLDGMTAAFGALFPSQIISPIMVLELGYATWIQKPNFVVAIPEILVRTGIASTVSYVIFTSLQDQTLLHALELPAAGYDALAELPPIDMLAAMIMGILCGFFGLIAFIVMAVFGKVGKTVEEKIDTELGQKLLGLPEDVLGVLLTPTIGGAIVGMLCKYDPLLLSDGADQLRAIVSLGSELGIKHIVASGFLKLLCVSISLGFGFVGGNFFPVLYAGTCTGVAVNLILKDRVPAVLCVACCMVAMPSAILPVLLTAPLLASVMLAMGGPGTSGVFLSCIMAFFTCSAMGVIQKMIQKALATTTTTTTTTAPTTLSNNNEGKTS